MDAPFKTRRGPHATPREVDMSTPVRSEPVPVPGKISLGEATRLSAKVGLLSFGIKAAALLLFRLRLGVMATVALMAAAGLALTLARGA